MNRAFLFPEGLCNRQYRHLGPNNYSSFVAYLFA